MYRISAAEYGGTSSGTRSASCRTGIDGQRRKQSGPSSAHCRTRPTELGFGHSHSLIGYVNLRLEIVQLRIVKHRPPITAKRAVLGRCCFPIRGERFLESGGDGSCRRLVLGANFAGGEQATDGTQRKKGEF